MAPGSSELRRKILRALRRSGYRFARGVLHPPEFPDKDSIRRLYEPLRKRIIEERRRWIERVEPRLMNYFADGSEVDPEKINPILISVEAHIERDLWNYASLLWSVPVGPGFGRRMRYLVMDDATGKLIGILGLCDPVIGLRARDQWIGWTTEDRHERLYHVMAAYALGAVPPYSYLLGGKLVALAPLAREVRMDFARRYGGRPSVISGKARSGDLVLVETFSALGRSSLLNRIRFEGRLLWQPIGWTKGEGHFLFMDGLFDDMLKFLRERRIELAYKYEFGGGPNWRMRVIKRCLKELGFSPAAMLKHGIQRQVFVAELAENAREFLRGGSATPRYYETSWRDLVSYFCERWLMGRARRDCRFRHFRKDALRLT